MIFQFTMVLLLSIGLKLFAVFCYQGAFATAGRVGRIHLTGIEQVNDAFFLTLIQRIIDCGGMSFMMQ